MTATPWGRKNSKREMSHNQRVTPPFAAMLGTTLRLKTATTNRATRSHLPRTRRRCGVVASAVSLVARCASPLLRARHRSGGPLLLRSCQGWGDLCKSGQVEVNIRFGVCYGDGPLLIPPIGLGHHAAIDHGKPILPPKVGINREPIAVVAHGLREKHQSAMGAGAGDVGAQARLFDFFLVTLDEAAIHP